MKHKLYWMDQTLCFGWVLCILANRYTLGSCIDLILALIIVFLRLTVSNDLARYEKRTWLPLVIYCVLFITSFLNQVDMGFGVMARYPFWILNLSYERIVSCCIGVVMFLWLLFYPIIVYLITLFKKKLVKTELRWTDLMGAILWTDKRGRLCSKLLLAFVGALLAGLAMNMPICLFMTLVAPALSYAFLCNYFDSRNKKRIGLLLIAMIIFFFAQVFAGIYRVGLLALSLLLVTYCCVQLYKTSRQFILSIVAIVYLGIVLPSLGIGNNQYACINYGRSGFYTVSGYNGIFFVVDKKNDFVGLRDRYGLILKPEFESIRCNHRGGSGFWNQVLELRRYGYTQLFDLNNTRLLESSSINDNLQKEIGEIVTGYITSEEVEYHDGCEIQVIELLSNKTLAWVRMLNYGNPMYLYETSKVCALADDFNELQPNTFIRDSLDDSDGGYMRTLSYVVNLPNDTLPIYRVGIKLSSREKQDSTAIIEIMDKIKQNKCLKYLSIGL